MDADSPSSFYTAPSSPVSSMSDDPTSETLHLPRYRPTQPVSKEIAHHCHIYFDEQLYLSGLTLVTALINSGTSHPNYLTTPALAPLPIHIEIISNLLVHPRYTTQAPRNERVELASRSISFLRSLLANLGPVNANLGEAFSLTAPRSRGWRRGRNGGGDEAGSESDSEEETAKLKGVVANKGRLRNRAKDFWHIVGWALNCSVVYHKRWKYWKVWLDYMLDVLDADWDERQAQDLEDPEWLLRSETDPSAQCEHKLLRNCLLVKHLADVRGRSSALKRVVEAAFVDGGPDDLRAYPEVFQNETLELKENGQKRKRDHEFEHKFGDYDDDEDDVEFDSFGSPASSQQTDDGDGIPAPDPWMGGPESIALRQRVLTLLSRVAYFLPDTFVSVRDLYDVYCRNMKILPLPAFSLLMSPAPSSKFPLDVYVTLSQLLLMRMQQNGAPHPQTVSHQQNDEITQEIIERCFLPFAANTSSTDDNAKVSLLAENILRLYLKNFKVYHTPGLDAAIEKGILARESKIKNDKRRGNNAARKKEEENDRVWLRASGERLRSLFAWVELQNHSDED